MQRREEVLAKTFLGILTSSGTPVEQGAPARGYINSDIPLDDWNRYQLAKTTGRE